MARIVVFQHNEYEHPGRLGLTLRDHGFKLDIRRPDLGPTDDRGRPTIPPDLDGVRGVIVMGGCQNVTDNLGWLKQETAFVRDAHEAQLPVIGVCLGHQIIAHALGGEVGDMARPEFGFADVELTTPAQTDRVFAGVRWKHPQFHCHTQEVKTPPPGATVMAGNQACEVQAFAVGLRTYAFQYHFECDRPLIDRFAREQQALFESAGLSADDVSAQSDKRYATYARLGDRMSVNIASFAFTFDELLKA